MRILLWHGYLLGGTGSNVYTRQLAREWSRAGHDVTVLSQEPDPARFDLGSAATARPDVGGLLPVFVLDRYEGYVVKRVPECTAQELEEWVEANASAIRALLPADLVFTNHVLLGGPVGAATRRSVRCQGARFRARVCDAWQCCAFRMGKRGAGGCKRNLRRVGAHPRGAGGGLRPRRPRPRGTAGRRHRPLASRGTRRGAGRPHRGGPSRRTEPGQRRGAHRGRRQCATARFVPRGRAADCRLLRKAHPAEGRPRAPRGDEPA